MRVFVGMLGYNRPDVIEGAMQNFEETVTPDHHIIKTLFSCGYPLPDAAQNRIKERELAAKYGWWNPNIPNEGVMGNWNRAIHEHFYMHPGDFLVTFDPDVRMRNKGWLPAMVDALQCDSTAMFACAARSFHNEEQFQKPPYNRKVVCHPENYLRIAHWDCLIAWSMGMWKADFLITRPRDFAQSGKFYGYSEHADYDRLVANKKTWISLADFYDDHLEAPDKEYLKWKHESAAKTTELSFDQWLKGKR